MSGTEIAVTITVAIIGSGLFNKVLDYIIKKREKNDDKYEAVQKANRLIMKDRLRFLCMHYIDQGWIYEDEFDSTDKIPVNVDPDYKYQSRFDTFMDRLARDFNRDVNLVSKVFDANKLKDFTPVEYAILIPEEIRKSRTVQFDANGTEDVSEDFILDANPQIAKLIVDIFHTSETLNELDANVNMSSYRNPLTHNFIYPEDICEFDANVEFSDSEVTEDIIIDANEGN